MSDADLTPPQLIQSRIDRQDTLEGLRALWRDNVGKSYRHRKDVLAMFEKRKGVINGNAHAKNSQ